MVLFKGTVESDFLKLASVADADKSNLINFAATDFLSLRQSLLEYVKSVYPLEYNYFSESDFESEYDEDLVGHETELTTKDKRCTNERM